MRVAGHRLDEVGRDLERLANVPGLDRDEGRGDSRPGIPASARSIAHRTTRKPAAGRGGRSRSLTRRTGQPLSQRNAGRAVTHAAAAAGLGKVGSHDLRRSFCSLAGRRGVDPIEAAQITGHSPDVWARHYARSFGKAQREEARRRMLEHGFGAAEPELHANGGANGPASHPLAPTPVPKVDTA